MEFRLSLLSAHGVWLWVQHDDGKCSSPCSTGNHFGLHRHRAMSGMRSVSFQVCVNAWFRWKQVCLETCRCLVVVCGRLRWGCGPPTAFPVGHQCTVGVLAGSHRCPTESRVTLWQSANPSWCVVVGVLGVVTSWCASRSCSWSCSALMCNWEYLHALWFHDRVTCVSSRPLHVPEGTNRIKRGTHPASVKNLG